MTGPKGIPPASKQACRQIARARRDALAPAFRREAARQVVATLLDRLQGPWRRIQHVGVYVAVQSELDLSTLFTGCWDLGISTYAPKIVSSRRATMAFAPLTDFNQLEAHPTLPISQPCTAPVKWDRLQLVCVPGLAFDRQGYRLGYGGGYFDRVLTKCLAFRLGIAYQAQWVPELPVAPHDVPMDAFLSEAGMKMYATCRHTIDV